MRIAILSTCVYRELKEINGKDRVVYDGGARYLLELCHYLQSKGHHVSVYQPILEQYTTDQTGKKVRINCGQIEKNFYGIPVICLPNVDDWSKYQTNHNLNRVFNEISIYFDLRIYFTTFLAYPHIVRPAITICHGIFWDYPAGVLGPMTEHEKREYTRRQLYGFTAPDACVAVDSNVRRVIAAMSPGSESRIYVVNNFVDTDKFTPAKKTWEGTNVLFPRRLTEFRGHNEFIKASMSLPQYNFLGVGQAGEESLEKNTSSWCETKQNIKFISREPEKMPEVYQGADIAVIPTRSNEGLALGLLESMSCGLPVITTFAGGLGDAVINGYNALMYDPNHNDLTVCIGLLANDMFARSKFGYRNREIAVECFDIKIWHERWKNLLRGFGA